MREWYHSGNEQVLLQGMQGLSRGLVERAEVYGVSPADAAEALRLVEALDAAIARASNPVTRTSLATAAKREALAAARMHCLRLIKFIRFNPNVSDADRLAIGVPPPAEVRRVPPPSTAPMLSLRGIVPGGHQLEFVDSANPDRRGKPHDVKGLELFVAYSPNQGGGGELSMDGIIQHAKPLGILTRGLSTVTHPDERVGSVANYIGRWINARGEAGPWSRPVRMLLAMPAGAARRRSAA